MQSQHEAPEAPETPAPPRRLVVAADDWRGCHHDGARGKGHGDGARGKGHGFLVAVYEENQLSMKVYVKHCET